MAWTRIAVVDDDRDFIAFMDDALSGEGYVVLTACDRTTGFDLIRDKQPDLIITDIRMDGAQAGQVLLSLLQSHPSSRSIPTIVCTADLAFLHANRQRLLDKGYLVLEKPFNLDDLFATIERALMPRHRLPGSGGHDCRRWH